MFRFLTFFIAGMIAVILFKAGAGFLPVLTVPTPPEPVGGNSARPQLILFTGSDWCPACKQLERHVLSRPEWKKFVTSEVSWRVIDVPRSGPTAAQAAMVKSMKISGYPTMVLKTRSGEEIGRKIGVSGDAGAYMSWVRGAR